MMVQLTSRIKVSGTWRAGGIARQVLVHGKLMATDATEYRMFRPNPASPDIRRMVRQGYMAIVTRVPASTAIEPDGNDVKARVVMPTPCFRVDVHAKNCFAFYLNL